MDNSHLEKILKIKAGQRLTSEERMEDLKNNLIYLKQISDSIAVNNVKLLDKVKITTDNEALSEYWRQVAIERQEFNDKFDKIMNELRNRDCGNSQ